MELDVECLPLRKRAQHSTLKSAMRCGAGNAVKVLELASAMLWRPVLWSDARGMPWVGPGCMRLLLCSASLLLATGRRFGVATNKLGGLVGAGHGAHRNSTVTPAVADRELLKPPNASHFRLSSHKTPRAMGGMRATP